MDSGQWIAGRAPVCLERPPTAFGGSQTAATCGRDTTTLRLSAAAALHGRLDVLAKLLVHVSQLHNQRLHSPHFQLDGVTVAEDVALCQILPQSDNSLFGNDSLRTRQSGQIAVPRIPRRHLEPAGAKNLLEDVRGWQTQLGRGD